ncbi:hypothetical protein DL240_06090 [Lujinxingia litoralis]|uniref:Glycosyltransferase n=1 Tax=Lujinxingia litoralis TaxID=2211119 RepID=A0A328C6Z9_9DELT|nr:TIGR04282 family arsenosugar biosynthesis glycosyltransferase [Lujinxingia litoralis]RAL23725.1 hypothetical protein DL240_06090 [Lujinxingia litoralis]
MRESGNTEVIIFAKAPVEGRVKTRLQPQCTPSQSVTLYRAFLKDVVEMVAGWVGTQDGARATVSWAGEDDDATQGWIREQGVSVVEQGEGDLGARMRRAIGAARTRGAETIIIVGADSPTLSGEHLSLASATVKRCDVVWGPSFDGGYYLVAVGAQEKSRNVLVEDVIFEGVAWSTADVLAQSWQCARRAGLLPDLLGFWYDVDTFEDVKVLEFHLLEFLESQGFEGARHTREVLLKWRHCGYLRS